VELADARAVAEAVAPPAGGVVEAVAVERGEQVPAAARGVVQLGRARRALQRFRGEVARRRGGARDAAEVGEGGGVEEEVLVRCLRGGGGGGGGEERGCGGGRDGGGEEHYAVLYMVVSGAGRSWEGGEYLGECIDVVVDAEDGGTG